MLERYQTSPQWFTKYINADHVWRNSMEELVLSSILLNIAPKQSCLRCTTIIDSRRGKMGQKWHVDSTEIRVQGRKCYFYRCIDKEGSLIDVYLSDTNNQDATEELFFPCQDLSGLDPEITTTDKEPALYPAMSEVFGDGTERRDVKCLNNLIEQDHRDPKSRYCVMNGFKNEFHALRFLGSYEEVRQMFNMNKKTRAHRREFNPSKIQQYYDLWHTAA